MKTFQTRPKNINDKFSLECPIKYIENLNKKDYEFADKYFNDLFCNNSKVVQSVLDIFKSLISGNLLRYVFFMTGEGRNGKSLVIKLLNQMFGSLMKVMDKSIIIENGVKSNLNTHLEKLETIRIGYISELKENDSLNGELIKGISGGDQQDVRGLYKSNTEIKPTANLICACNHLPKFNVEDKALIDRLVVIPFNNRFEINTSFENDLLEKIDIIFSYIMQKGVITDKFDFPDEMIEATKLYVKENDNDPLRDYIDSNIKLNVEEKLNEMSGVLKETILEKLIMLGALI
jgi:P4 family phage/plasmid primase-like protien